MVREVHIGRTRRDGLRDPGQGEIVGRDQPNGTAVDQTPHDRFGSDAAVVGVGSVQDLIEKKESRGLFGQLHDLSRALDLGVEA